MAKNPEHIRHTIIVCQGSDCKDNGSKEIYKAVESLLKRHHLTDESHLVKTKCNGFCNRGAIVSYQPANVWLTKATAESTLSMLEQFLLDRPLEEADAPSLFERIAALRKQD